ncbi:erythroid differentiation-related factor 1-like isoform X1 [Mya arenaria]|uniref:erythroid differentiation-related factor 1-like isoform X1 n=1 Tax=Mya arenaria TaxID=6604 RepID=UPI0022E75CAF|nr:erythroid differentiation-related factor 1-like isoform X1 [Mya arenaria]
MSDDIDNKDRQLVPVDQKNDKSIVPYHGVRSMAEVKHGIVHFESPFSQLSLNTDLNIPPSNWLRTSSKLEQHVRDLTWNTSRRPSQFSSIDIAHNTPDIVGEVDVISHAANIKKLLKIPFEKSHVSMMVHRVGKTLLLDEFDIHKQLLRTEQNEWGWLRRFYYECVLRDLHHNMKCVPRPSKRRDSLQNRNMYSKFLYHSVCDTESDVSVAATNRMLTRDDLSLIPDPLPKPRGSQTSRDVLWTFEDIKMLIGTDLPVFRDESYYVSLRLRDMKTPINVLTGLDYWLDNLMCNVPEVAMCFHIEGIVKQYEIIKTEDIPDLENSKFDPQSVTDIAKNILSFLKNNATKEGHTYWLYKGTNDDVVKLYDLTALCGDERGPSEQNPFTVPLGMLLYRVARNMWTNQTPRKASLMRTLLENCLILLDGTQHPQVCTSASYLLSDLYVPDSSLDDDWSLPGSSSEENSDEESQQDVDNSGDSGTHSVDVKVLSKRGSVSRAKELTRLKPFNETAEERCTEATKFIQMGLSYLRRDLDLGTHKRSSLVEEQAKCNSDEAIPLHYEPIRKNEKNANKNTKTHTADPDTKYEVKVDLDLQMTSVTPDSEVRDRKQDQSWHVLSKGLLFRKAAFTFSALAKQALGSNNLLDLLKFLKLAFSCFGALKVILPHKAEENDALLSSLYGLLGDARLGLLKTGLLPVDWPVIWKTSPPEECAILEMTEKEFETFEFESWFDLPSSKPDILKGCVQCYKMAVQLCNKKNKHVFEPLVKREGNAYNELGVCLMQQAQNALESSDLQEKSLTGMQTTWDQASQALKEGIGVFECIEDKANQALLHCNLGRLMRLIAQTYTNTVQIGNKQEFTPLEREYYNKAINSYKTALQLGNQGFKHLVESVRWELSTTYFNMAALLQDYAPLTSVRQEEVENEVVNLMFQSLKYCGKDNASFASQTMYQFRAATINHRLASLFHNSLRDEHTEQKRKHLRTLSESHYEKALKLYYQMECYNEHLQTQLEYIALLDLCLSGQTAPRHQLKTLLYMLHSLTDCSESLKSLTSQLEDSNQTSDQQTSLLKESHTISTIMETKLQHTLLQLVKVYKQINSRKSGKEASSKADDMKKLYAASLGHGKADSDSATVISRCKFLLTVLTQVTCFYQEVLQKDLEVRHSLMC